MFLSDIVFLGKTARIFLIGNNLGERCVIERVINNAEQLKFNTVKVPVMVDNQPTWEEKQNLDEIIEERNNYASIGKLDIWYAEKMCQALAEESRIFKDEDYRYYSPSRKDDLIGRCNLFACLDPASSTNPSACYRAITVTGVDSENYWFNAYLTKFPFQLINQASSGSLRSYAWWPWCRSRFSSRT